jgi:dual oxidase
VRLYDVIVNSTDIKPSELQNHVFFWVKGDPCPQPAQLNTSLLEPCKYLQGYDYFEVQLYTLWQRLEERACVFY